MTSSWRRRAQRLAAALPRSRLHPAVSAWAARRPAGEGWAVAFSGGSDSLCLLLLLWAHWPERRRHLRALHFNHRLRGAAAGADARFCRAVCRGLGVGCSAGAWAGARRGATEAQARSARFAFFRREMGARRLRPLWLGHQRDDVAESMLMRLARGSGAGGLAAPRPVQPAPEGRLHLRPLLELTKAEIAAALRACAVPWREDASNSGDDFFRNRLRRRVLPAWRRAAAGRDALAGAARSRSLLEEDDRALEEWAGASGALVRNRIRLDRLAGLPRAVVRRVLHRWLVRRRLGERLSARGFEALLDSVLLGRPARFSLGPDGFATIRRGALEFERGRRQPRRPLSASRASPRARPPGRGG